MRKIWQNVICPNCQQRLSLAQVSPKGAILRCQCANYPLIEGILYLQRNSTQKHAANLLLQRKYYQAFLALCATQKHLALLLLFLWYTQILTKLGFANSLRLIGLFSFPQNWIWYLLHRQHLPSYYFAQVATGLLVKQNALIVDIGCGTGQIFPWLYQRSAPNRICGLDKSFLNLLLARAFFAKPETLLLCADVEKGLPFKSRILDLVLASDSFHYIQRKPYFLQEVNRVTNSSGKIAFTHILNNPGSQSAERGISPLALKQLLKVNQFSQQVFLTNATFWSLIRFGLPISLDRSDPPKTLQKAYAYSVLAVKKDLPYLKKGPQVFYRPAQLEAMVYQNDPQLKSVTGLAGLLWAFDHFLFISPHLDDAVLSSGLLLQHLNKAGKKMTVATLFTCGDPQVNSPLVKSFLKKCEFTDVDAFFRQRRREDQGALTALKANYFHAGFTDAAWRINPTTRKLLYPTSVQLFSGKPAAPDKNLLEPIGRAIKKLALTTPQAKTLLLAPLGIGGHIDHVLVHQAVGQLQLPTLYWEDFPYNTWLENTQSFFLQHRRFTPVLTLESTQGKIPLINFYRSQLKALFPTGTIPLLPEKYYQLLPETFAKT